MKIIHKMSMNSSAVSTCWKMNLSMNIKVQAWSLNFPVSLVGRSMVKSVAWRTTAIIGEIVLLNWLDGVRLVSQYSQSVCWVDKNI